jgi:hypothetical protein
MTQTIERQELRLQQSMWVRATTLGRRKES